MIDIAFQGSPGAYSHEALNHYFKEQVKPQGFELSEQVVEAVINKEVSGAILPVENSIVGNVTLNSDLLYQNPLFIIGEHYQEIQHCLLAPKGTKLHELKTVHSHPIALAQCRNFLNQNKLIAKPESDTAGAAAQIAREKKKGEAAISSKLCAELYELDILASSIQHTPKNFTRFVIFVRKDHVPLGLKREKASLAFRTQHRPGALLECLQVFAKHNINLSKLESRPVPENPFQYVFYVDFLGDPTQKNVKACLEDLDREAQTLKILGFYPKSHFQA